MHNHYFTLKKAAHELEAKLKGAQLREVFSQQKNELVLVFSKNELDLYLRIFLYPEYQSFYFTESFAKARGQVFHCFHDAWGKSVESIHPIPFDRCLLLKLSSDHTFILKLYGRRSNLVLHRPNHDNELYHRHFQSDGTLIPGQLTGRFIPAEAAFDAQEPCQTFPVFEESVVTYIKAHLQNSSNPYLTFIKMLQELSENNLFLQKNPPKLSFLPSDGAMDFSSALQALEAFNRVFMKEHFFEATKHRLLNGLINQKNKTEKYLATLLKRKRELEERVPPGHLADILMANLHAIPTGITEIELFNFYTEKNIQIKLKKDLSPQKNAENYYRKSKNEKLESEELFSLIESKHLELETLKEKIQQLEQLEDWTSLKLLDKEKQKQAEAEELLPYKMLLFQGWEIRIGKNAKSNDELTQRHSHKDDLWLHARDVSGSHVLIKHQSGKNFPKNVIERAAELAAWYSKRKTDSLCPVMVTPKKFVRKKKGAREGSVIVEKEDVVMVVPKGL